MNGSFKKPHHFLRYHQSGVYFITITTKDKVHYFGKVEHGRMICSKLGYKAQDFISELPGRFRNITVDTFKVMPNHVHLLIRIKRERIMKYDLLNTPVTIKQSLELQKSLELNQSITMNRCTSIYLKDLIGEIKPKGLHPLEKGSISSVINHYKGRLTLWCRNHNYPEFEWQINYFDKTIYSDYQYEKAWEYIKNNPLNWDKNNH